MVPPLAVSTQAASRTLRAAAFWTAVALPVTVIAVLAVGGGLRLAGVLLACNAAALLLGHDHRSTPHSRTAGRRPNREH